MDDDIEEAQTILDKEQIETEKAYDDCNVILKEFDKNNSQFSEDVYNLLNIYADAVKNVIISNSIIDSHYSIISLFSIFFSSKAVQYCGRKCL